MLKAACILCLLALSVVVTAEGAMVDLFTDAFFSALGSHAPDTETDCLESVACIKSTACFLAHHVNNELNETARIALLQRFWRALMPDDYGPSFNPTLFATDANVGMVSDVEPSFLAKLDQPATYVDGEPESPASDAKPPSTSPPPNPMPETERIVLERENEQAKQKLKDEGTQISCSTFFDCVSCISHNCGWCVGARKCVRDIPWQCQGETDHIGSIGTSQSCPTEEEMREERQMRHAQKDAALKELEDVLDEVADPFGEGPVNASEDVQQEARQDIPPPPKDPEHEKARQRAVERLLRRRREEESRIRREGIDTDGDSDGKEKIDRLRHAADIKRRATLATKEPDYGARHPYEVLSVNPTSTQGQIRRAYRRLSIRFHPDKNQGDLAASASKAFSDIVAAYEVIGNPDKRAAFDDFGHANADEGFETYWEYMQSQTKSENDFYTGDILITSLSEKLWERRLYGETIWLVQFYAPWCSHCQRMTPQMKAVASMLEVEDVAVGAVNCAKEANLCHNRHNVRAYPTIRLLNQAHGAQQDYLDGEHDAQSIYDWAKEVVAEWRWLFAESNVVSISAATFRAEVLNSTDFWILVFLDGLDCAPCRTASTNLLRLSASLSKLARCGFVDCEQAMNRDFCYLDMEVPQAPHSPLVKVWRAGRKVKYAGDELGERLYNPNQVDPHVALELVERAVRLSRSDELDTDEDALIVGKVGQFESDPTPRPPPPPPKRPQPSWNGPPAPERLPWGGGGRGRAVPRIRG